MIESERIQKWSKFGPSFSLPFPHLAQSLHFFFFFKSIREMQHMFKVKQHEQLNTHGPNVTPPPQIKSFRCEICRLFLQDIYAGKQI